LRQVLILLKLIMCVSMRFRKYGASFLVIEKQGNKRYWSEKQKRGWDERLNNTRAINNSYESIVKRNSA